MKGLFIILLGILLIAASKLDAQNCMDTVHIKGYYVIQKIASELSPEIKRKGNKVTMSQRIDTHSSTSFIPCDSINKKHPLSYWLNHFWDTTTKVFISCEAIRLKYLVRDCPIANSQQTDTCLFPVLQSKSLYQTTNENTGEVFEIYYLDAYWGKIKIKKGTMQETMVPSRIAEVCISPSVKGFDLYYFIRCSSYKVHPKIKDPHIRVWKK